MTITYYDLPACDHKMSAVRIERQDYYFAPETRMWYAIDSADDLIAAIEASTDDHDAYSIWCASTSPEEITEATHGDIWRSLNESRSAKGGAA